MTQPAYSVRQREKTRLNRAEFIPLCLVLCFYAALHLIIRPNFGDDLTFARALDDSALLPWLKARYYTWSSRLLPDAALVLVLRLPVLFWKAADVGMLLLLFHSLRFLLDQEMRLRDGTVLAMLLCCYPFSQMGSAGWITTTVIYLWPLALLAYSLSGMWRNIRGEALHWRRYLLYASAALFACGNELAAVMLLAASVWGIVYAKKQGHQPVFAWACLLIAAGGIALAFFSPGNAGRMETEIGQWMPGFHQMSPVNKLHLGIVSTFEHFTSLPSVALFLLCFLTCAQVSAELSGLKKRMAGYVPLIIQVGFTVYFLLTRPLIKSGSGFAQQTAWPENMGPAWFAVAAPAAFALMAAGLICSLVFLIRDRCRLCTILLALAMGLATRLSLSFSPTVIASGTRTYMFLYIILLAVAFVLWKRGLPKKAGYVFLASAGAGMIYNIAGVWLLQRNF